MSLAGYLERTTMDYEVDSEYEDITTAAANAGHTGAMVALVPSDADVERLTVDGGEAPEQLHLTLAFLGEAAVIEPETREAITTAIGRYATAPINAQAFSVNVFNPQGDEPCVVLGVGNGGPELEELRSNVMSTLRGMSGLMMPDQHTPWVPHITLAYTDDPALALKVVDRTGPVTFDKIRVAFGDEVTDIPLGEPVTAAGFKKNQARDKGGKWTRDPAAAVESIDARAKRLDAVLSKSHNLSTVRTHANNGFWSKQRDATHRKIVDELFAASADVPSDGKVIFTGGNAGAGKTTVMTQQAGIDLKQYIQIDPDKIKEELAARGLIPEIPNQNFSPMERSTLVHRESVRIAEMLADKAMKARKNIIWDGTMGNPQVIKHRVKRLRDHGYGDIEGLFVDVTDETSERRMADRHARGQKDWRAGKGHGGRYIPTDVQSTISSAELRSSFEKMRDVFTEWRTYDNNANNAPARLMKSGGKK